MSNQFALAIVASAALIASTASAQMRSGGTWNGSRSNNNGAQTGNPFAGNQQQYSNGYQGQDNGSYNNGGQTRNPFAGNQQQYSNGYQGQSYGSYNSYPRANSYSAPGY